MLTDREKKVLVGVRRLIKRQVEINVHATRAYPHNDVLSVSFLTTLAEYNDLRHELGLAQEERPDG